MLEKEDFLNNEIRKSYKGMTIVEVVISFTVALILIMALYSIVYWGSTSFSNINQKLIDISNASVFIETELTRNSGKYFYLEPIAGREGQFDLRMNVNTPAEIFNLVNTLGYNRYNKIREIRISQPVRINNTNLYKVEVELMYEHKNLRRINRIEIYLTANSFKIGVIQPNIPSVDVGTFTVAYPNITDTTTTRIDNTIGNTNSTTTTDTTTTINDTTTNMTTTTTTTTTTATTGTTTTATTTTTTITTNATTTTGGGGGGGGCFELSCLILTKEQDKYILKKMSEVKIGDIVLTIDPVENYKLKEIEVKKIHLHDKQEWEIMEIITESGKIRLTPNHPLIIDENNNNKKAGKLKVGDKILVYKEGKYNWEEIKEIRREVIVDKVMTLELKEEINTFLVSVDGNTFILAHSGYSHINTFKVLASASIGGALLFLAIINYNLTSEVFAVNLVK